MRSTICAPSGKVHIATTAGEAFLTLACAGVEITIPLDKHLAALIGGELERAAIALERDERPTPLPATPTRFEHHRALAVAGARTCGTCRDGVPGGPDKCGTCRDGSEHRARAASLTADMQRQLRAAGVTADEKAAVLA